MAGGKNSARAATTEAKRQEAVELRKRGRSYQQIATALGCSKPYAFQLVTESLAECVAERKEDSRHIVETELQRLDAMLDAMWNAATCAPPADATEDVIAAMVDAQLAAVDRVVKLMDRRAKYLGLDAASKQELTGADGGPIAIEDVRSRLRAKLARLDVAGGPGGAPSEPDGTGTPGA